MSRSIIKKTLGVGSSTLLSRFFAYIREMLLIQFLGIGAISDAFFIALRVPNSLRKVFAEGALSSVLVPALVHAERQGGKAAMNRLLTLSFVFFEVLVAFIIVGIYFSAGWIVSNTAPGASVEQLQASVQFLQILAPFILFLSSSAVLAGALQATHNFFLPALAPALLNLLYVLFLVWGLYASWSVSTFCWMMLVAAAINFLVHVVVCVRHHFYIALPDAQSVQGFKHVLYQLLPCLLSVGIGEINFWIDSAFASRLESGTLSLLRYAYQFVNIPLGVMVTSLSIVLLSHFAKIGHSKEELGMYLGEALKFVVWMMLPITIVMIYSSREIFETMFFSDKFSMYHVLQAQSNMNAYLVGLTFFSLEKILLNAFYALRPKKVQYCKLEENEKFQNLLANLRQGNNSLKQIVMNFFKMFTMVLYVNVQNLILFFQTIPPVSFATGVAILTIGMNYFMNSWLMSMYGGTGLALATSVTAAVRIMMFMIILYAYFGINFHFKQLGKLLCCYGVQLTLFGTCFIAFAEFIKQWIINSSFSWIIEYGSHTIIFNTHFFLHSFGYWMWFAPLVALFFMLIYATRKIFNVSISYLD